MDVDTAKLGVMPEWTGNRTKTHENCYAPLKTIIWHSRISHPVVDSLEQQVKKKKGKVPNAVAFQQREKRSLPPTPGDVPFTPNEALLSN